jgi:hypothetical protein
MGGPNADGRPLRFPVEVCFPARIFLDGKGNRLKLCEISAENGGLGCFRSTNLAMELQ